MSKNNLFRIIIFVICVIILISIIIISKKEGPFYFGDVWSETPEEALQDAADNPTHDKRTLTVKELLDKRVINGDVKMTFVSENDTLTSATIITNDDGKYHLYGYTEEGPLESPSEFVLNGDKDQFILFPYGVRGSTVYGWSYSSVSLKVNGITPSTETHTFECQGKTWSLNFWWIDDFPNTDNVNIQYVD